MNFSWHNLISPKAKLNFAKATKRLFWSVVWVKKFKQIENYLLNSFAIDRYLTLSINIYYLLDWAQQNNVSYIARDTLNWPVANKTSHVHAFLNLQLIFHTSILWTLSLWMRLSLFHTLSVLKFIFFISIYSSLV